MDAFDFSFESYATPAVVTVVYVLTVVCCALAYVVSVLMAFVIFMPDQKFLYTQVPGSAAPGIITLALGWIPGLIVVLGVRVALEQALATVRTATDARALRTRYVAQAYV